MRVMQTTSERGLDHSLLPMRLYHKAKKLGVWDPRDIDLTPKLAIIIDLVEVQSSFEASGNRQIDVSI